METFRLENMVKGWFVGNFEPTAYKTKEFEVSYKLHPKGEEWPHHYHKVATEINLLIRGEMIIQNKKLTPGDIFILKPMEVADPEFLEDCEIVCIKTKSIKNDKYEIDRT